jgi:hypothetical protein
MLFFDPFATQNNKPFPTKFAPLADKAAFVS